MIWINGKYYRNDLAKVSVLDRGFLYGDGLFETFPVYNRVPFCLAEHLERLYAGLKELKISIPYSQKELGKAIQGLIQKSKIRESAMRLTVTRGVGSGGFAISEKTDFTVVIIFRQMPKIYDKNGIRAVVSSIRQNEYSPLSRLKTCNSLPYIFALNEAKEAGVEEAILLNTSGHLAECAMHNVFWIQGKIIYTPKIECGVLPGITRGLVLKLVKKNKIQCKEVSAPLSSLLRADEAFVTNSLRGIQPLVNIRASGKKKSISFPAQLIGNGKPGQMTIELQKIYQDYMLKRCGL
jgi:aminodeoxychorismate lyase